MSRSAPPSTTHEAVVAWLSAHPTTAARFWMKVDRGDDDACWEWLACRDRDGYGSFGLRTGLSYPAHRVAWLLTHGPIPAGLLVCHRCDNPSCNNPRHLFVGTHLDNMRDLISKGRRAHHVLQPTDVRLIRQLIGHMTQRVIAARFGVTQSAISLIATGRTWADV